MAFLVTSITFDLAQVPIALLLIFFNGGSINAGCEGVVRGLALLTSLIQTRILFGR